MRAFSNDHDDIKSNRPTKPKASYKKLALDTSFSRHRAVAPQQVFPAITSDQNVSDPYSTDVISASTAIRRAFSRKTQRRAPSLRRPGSRRRPSPLKLDHDSLRDGRVAVNGTSGLLPEPSVLGQVEVMRSAKILAYKTYDTQKSLTPQLHQGVPTPRIIITPARESFTPSPDPSSASTLHRPASSVYSRYTNYLPNFSHNSHAPPLPNVPPFQLVSTGKGHIVSQPHHSVGTNFEEDHASICARSENSPSSSQAREELDQLTPLPGDMRGMTPGLPTPQRSHGWWNVLTSPFSARSGSFFSRSPSLNDEYDETTDLRPESRQEDRSIGDDQVRLRVNLKPFRSLKRSRTAPGALDPHARQEFSIYHLAHGGEADAYFDETRRFPSVCGIPDAATFGGIDDDLVGWSPSHSVFMAPRTVEGDLEKSGGVVLSPDQLTPKATFQAIPNNADTTSLNVSSREPSIQRNVFISPSADEMKTMFSGVSPPSRSQTQVTGADSLMSPLSATPVVQHAHMATFMGPDSSFGEPRKVDVASRRSSPSDQASKHIAEPEVADTKPAHLGHQRQESYGLGITSEKAARPPSLPPPPPKDTLSDFTPSEKERAISMTSLEEGERSKKTPWFRRFFWPIAAFVAVLLALMVVLLVLFVRPKAPTSSLPPGLAVQASWLNTTGFPAAPVGVTTVAQPKLAQADGTCMPSASLWSCNAGNEQGMGSGEDAGIPNFRLQVSFRNGTLPSSQTALLSRHLNSRIVPRHRLHARDSATDILFTPAPNPPTIGDMRFIGQTTDGISTAPFEGEETPFYISLLSPKVLSKRSDEAISKRMPADSAFPYPTNDEPSNSGPSGNTNSQPSTTPTVISGAIPSTAPTVIPAITTQKDGRVASPILYPLVAAQPLRLFDRGKPTEHYGFYTYFDRIQYITHANDTSLLTSSSNSSSSSPTTPTQYALIFSQSRFHVQIWTRRGTLHSLPSSSSTDNSPPAKDSSANNFTSTGSLPYPVTFTLDRHGGQATAKGVYAYEMDPVTNRVVNGGRKFWVDEKRGAQLVGAAGVPRSLSPLGKKDGSVAGGVDGGSGGCSCRWTTT